MLDYLLITFAGVIVAVYIAGKLPNIHLPDRVIDFFAGASVALLPLLKILLYILFGIALVITLSAPLWFRGIIGLFLK